MDDGNIPDLLALSRFLKARFDENRAYLLTEAQGSKEEPGGTAARKAGFDQPTRPAGEVKAAIRVPQPRRPTGDFQPPAGMSSPTGQRDRKALRTASGLDLAASPQDDPHATPAAICPVGGFDKHSPIIMDFARRSKENFALVAMFAPLSAMTPMHVYVIHFPVVLYFPREHWTAAPWSFRGNSCGGIAS